MTEHDTTRLLERLASTFPDRPAPLPQLMAAAGAARRRRIRVVAAAVAAAIVVVAGGAVALERSIGPETVGGPEVVDAVEPDLPLVPFGRRFAGVGRVAVPVPEEWEPQDPSCFDTGQGLFLRNTARAACVVDFLRAREPAIGFLDLNSDVGERAADFATEPDEIDGVPVLRGPFCPPNAACVINWHRIVVVPSEDLVVVAPVAAGRQGTSRLLTGLRILPEGWTTVPVLNAADAVGTAANAIVEAGLTYRASAEGEALSGRSAQYGTDPVAGTVVPLGTEVTLLLEPYRQPLTPEQIAAVNDIVEDRLADEPQWFVSDIWARPDTGTVRQQNVGKCISGELLRISLVGRFNIVVGGTPVRPGTRDPLADTVTEVRLVADARTREICAMAVRTGTYTPDPAYTQLLDLQ